MEILIKMGHLRRYIREANSGEEYALTADKTIASVPAPFESKSAINYILGGPFDYQYQSKCQQKKLLKAATIKTRVNAAYARGSQEETKPIDGLISFPPVNTGRVIVPHHDALVLTHCINGFDVHKVLVNPGSTVDMLQLPAFNHMKLSSQMLNSVG